MQIDPNMASLSMANPNMASQNMASPNMAGDVVDMMSRLPPKATGTDGVQFEPATRQGRQLPDRILVAVHQACDLGELDVAGRLLSILEEFIGKCRRPIDPALRRLLGSTVAVHQRLWYLRHPGEAVCEEQQVPRQLLQGSMG